MHSNESLGSWESSELHGFVQDAVLTNFTN